MERPPQPASPPQPSSSGRFLLVFFTLLEFFNLDKNIDVCNLKSAAEEYHASLIGHDQLFFCCLILGFCRVQSWALSSLLGSGL